jgi:hypothetical protein
VDQNFNVVGQAQYVIFLRPLIQDGKLIREEIPIYRAKEFNFLNDTRWALTNVSITRMSDYIFNFESFHEQLQLFINFNEFYTFLVDLLEASNYETRTVVNPTHRGISGRPIVISKTVHVSMPRVWRINDWNNLLLMIFEGINENSMHNSIGPIFNQKIASIKNIETGIRFMENANGREYDYGVTRFNSGMSHFRAARTNLRNMFSAIKDQLDYIGPPDFVLPADLNKYYRLSIMSNEIIGYQLFGAYFDF